MVNIDKFGKDHWSTFAYVETRCVDYGGRLNNQHMRCDINRHPGFDHNHSCSSPTIVKDGNIKNHDDWDCVDDLVAEGLIERFGTGIYPVFSITKRGQDIATTLRRHKANGGRFGNFNGI